MTMETIEIRPEGWEMVHGSLQEYHDYQRTKLRVYIYALTRAGAVFYIGQTIEPKRRFSAHRHTLGQDIDIVILQAVQGRDAADKAERTWIWFYAQKGPILNKRHNEKLRNPPLSWILDKMCHEET